MGDIKIYEKIEIAKKKLETLESKLGISKSLNMSGFANNNPFPVVRIDERGKILISNLAANEYFEIDVLRGKDWNKLVQVEPNSIKVVDGHLQHEYVLKGRTLLFCYRNVVDLGHVNIYGFDISHQREVERELEVEKARHLHSAKMATLGEMAGGMAHELNTPLCLMALSINQIEKCLEKGKIELLRNVLDEMDQAVLRMSKLISGFKTFSREDRNGEFSFVSFKKILEESIAICEMGLKGTSIHFDFPKNIPDISIECNPTELSQVIINLVHNARDAIENDNKPWIKIHIDISNSMVFQVIDSGNGIPEDILEKIFIPFFTTKEIGKGTGLGLPIIKEIIEKHNGELIIDRENENTCFKFELPLVQTAGEFL